MPKPIITSLLFLLCCTASHAQEAKIANAETKTLALSDVISLALNRNLSLERSKLQIELRENDLAFEEADSKPNLTGSVGGTLRFFGENGEPVWEDADTSRSLL